MSLEKILINRTSDSDLMKLAKDLNIKNFIVCSKSMLKKYLTNPKIKNIIFNMSNSDTNGTHWVALNKNKKLYYDSYAQPAPVIVPKNYKLASQNKEIQSLDSSMCGSLCLLWIYYTNYKSNDEYYNLFKDCYK